ncbi:collagen-binding protein [Vagococcus acidifermentans]|uniref:Collagen-binding protein n=2 Tax=Vagococcus acidifermentans TaxID=564710 RepID=A0A430APB0_9ENTE|nr:collagen-binding protein [Vagococcus acidifermentans]
MWFVGTVLSGAYSGVHWTDDGVYMKKAEGSTAFCIEHGVNLNGGSVFTPSELTIKEKDRLSLIAYYGYQLAPNAVNYGITQNIIWEEMGDKLLTTNLPNYATRKSEILAKVAKHNAKPSFHDQTVELNVGDTLTLTDTANVLSNYGQLISNSANLKLEKNGNSLKLTATKESKEKGEVRYGIAAGEHVGQSFVYYKAGEQKVATFKLANAGEMLLNIRVNLNGDVKIKKVDEDTGKPVPNTKMKVEYDGQTKEITTDEHGYATISDLKAGTKVIITEVTASNGYVNKGERKEIIVEPNKTIEVIFDNKAQQGILQLKKTGQKATSVKTENTSYGVKHDIQFDYQPLANVVFDIQTVEDIKVGDHIHAKKGETVATVKTDESGELMEMPRLYLGKYEAIEKETPAGFIPTREPIPFEFTYEGQEVELVSQSVEVTNDFQQLKINVYKNEERISEWQDNQPIIETIPGEGQIFGLFTNQEFKLSQKNTVPKDALLEFGTIQEGSLFFPEMQLPEGHYYVKELAASDSHQIDEIHYEFEFAASNHEPEVVIDIYGNEDAQEGNKEPAPILNKLHFNDFAIKKINEKAELVEKQGYEFEWDSNGKGAVFTLETADGEVIQTVTVVEDSIAEFKQIPVGIFYLKEKKPSSTDYILSSEKYQIVSTLEGIEAFDEQGKLIGTTIEGESTKDEDFDKTEVKEPEETEPLILFEVKNHLIKGTAELTKTDVSTGEPLPNTGIRIMDASEKIVVEGQTDEKGIFRFEKLPAGKYYFQEFSAPAGYELDETLMPFEISKEGEVVKCQMTNKKILNKKEVLPQTGEKNSALLWVGILMVSVATGVGYYVKKKKK